PLGVTPTAADIGADGALVDGSPSVFVTPAEGYQVEVMDGTNSGLVASGDPGYVYGTAATRALETAEKFVWVGNNLGTLEYAVRLSQSVDWAGISNSSNWNLTIPLASPEPDIVDTSLNSSTHGTYVVYTSDVAGNPHLLIRRFQATTMNAFGPPTSIEGPSSLDDDIGEAQSAQDSSGRIHVLWHTTAGGGRLRYTRSDTSGATFSAPANLAFGETFGAPHLAAAPDGSGYAVWRGSGGAIRVVRLDPLGEPTPAPVPGPPPTPTPSPSPSPRPTPSPGPITRTTTSTVPGASISLGVPTACVKPGSTFKVTLTWKRQKRKGNVFVKVTRADFSIGSKVVKIDRSAPFTQTLRVTASARIGSTITVRARAYIKVKKGKAPKKSLRTSINVCA
ncbi:MAG TPA: hypothetical protein VII98_10115, partial [Solirubrobacteraceae bacterium]